ncbi:putative transglycosylase signal peptide protein [Xenorhabdus budapestensis]|uniref:Putative transglycosylase signal peptide protein n=1 Tax=Xenorhabdus budapestensis TaxID=290110 RepID=A0A2D0IKT7_XENBU|nr:putative transglycosylase signal peptide protein [Xenorhabdus budapestensis]
MLDSTREALRFGGNETLETTGGLNNRLRDMSRYAQDNVQNISSMIPPLKNFGELFSKYSGMASKMGLLGGVGGVIGGMTAGYNTLRETGKEATGLDTLSKNTAMSHEDASGLAGALVQIGADADDAKKSVQNLFDVFNAAERGENGSARAELDKAGVKIHTTKDGSADTIPTLLELAEKFPNMPSETQFRLANKLGLTPDVLTLIRENKIKERLEKSKKYGLTMDEKTVKRLTDFDTEMNDWNAWREGKKLQSKTAFAEYFLEGGLNYQNNLEKKEKEKYKNDTSDSFYHGNKRDDMRERALRDKEFRKELSFGDRFLLEWGYPSDDLYKKLEDKYGEAWEKQKKAHEAKAAVNKIPPLPNYEMPHYPNPLKSGGNGAALLESMSDYFAMLEKKYGHEPGLLYGVAMTESSGNPNAIGPVTKSGEQAMGMFQFMPDTAKEQGLIGNDVFDPYKSAEASARYLSWLRQQTGSTDGMLAAYNGGIGKLQARGIRNMPTETRNYIPEVKKNMKVGAAIAEKNINSEQEQQFPSLYSKKKDVESEAEIAKGMAKALLEAMGDKPFQVEITLVNDKTGERQKFQSNSAGKVTTSMQHP